MKKRWLAILCSALVFMLALAVGAVMVSAESSIELDVGYSNLPEYMLTDELGNETVDTSKYLWRIHHTDGTIDYREQFYAFDNIREGDVFEFLPETYALSKLDYASGKTGIAGETGDTVNVYHDFTIDFRGSRLYPKETGDTGRNVFHLAGRAPSTVTVLVEDAELYASPEGRGLFYVNGDLEVIIDGGVRGGSLHAPAAINLEASYKDPARASQIINVDIYRISGNKVGS